MTLFNIFREDLYFFPKFDYYLGERSTDEEALLQDWNWFDAPTLTKGQETKLRIMTVAMKLFSKNGFNQITLNNIAKESKTSHPLILKHFGSKENLLFSVRKYVSHSNHKWVDSKIKPEMSGIDALITHCYENINWGYHNRDQAKIILLTYYYSSLDGPNSKMGMGAFKVGIQRLHQYILQGQREGAVSSSEKSELLAEIIHEYAVGLFTKMLATESSPKNTLPRSYKKKLVQIINNTLTS